MKKLTILVVLFVALSMFAVQVPAIASEFNKTYGNDASWGYIVVYHGTLGSLERAGAAVRELMGI